MFFLEETDTWRIWVFSNENRPCTLCFPILFVYCKAQKCLSKNCGFKIPVTVPALISRLVFSSATFFIVSSDFTLFSRITEKEKELVWLKSKNKGSQIRSGVACKLPLPFLPAAKAKNILGFRQPKFKKTASKIADLPELFRPPNKVIGDRSLTNKSWKHLKFCILSVLIICSPTSPRIKTNKFSIFNISYLRQISKINDYILSFMYL